MPSTGLFEFAKTGSCCRLLATSSSRGGGQHCAPKHYPLQVASQLTRLCANCNLRRFIRAYCRTHQSCSSHEYASHDSVSCGHDRPVVSADGDTCNAGLAVDPGDFNFPICVDPSAPPAPPCGATGEPCCTGLGLPPGNNGCAVGNNCNTVSAGGADTRVCEPCGATGADCCRVLSDTSGVECSSGNTCTEGFFDVGRPEGALCVPCGSLGQPCCLTPPVTGPREPRCGDGLECGPSQECVAAGSIPPPPPPPPPLVAPPIPPPPPPLDCGALDLPCCRGANIPPGTRECAEGSTCRDRFLGGGVIQPFCERCGISTGPEFSFGRTCCFNEGVLSCEDGGACDPRTFVGVGFPQCLECGALDQIPCGTPQALCWSGAPLQLTCSGMMHLLTRHCHDTSEIPGAIYMHPLRVHKCMSSMHVCPPDMFMHAALLLPDQVACCGVHADNTSGDRALVA